MSSMKAVAWVAVWLIPHWHSKTAKAPTYTFAAHHSYYKQHA